MRTYFISNSMSLMDVFVLIFPMFTCTSFSSVHLLRNFSISSKLSNLLAQILCLFIYVVAVLVAKLGLTLEIPWTAAHQPMPMKFSRHQYWNGLSFPSPVDLPDPWIKPTSPALVGRFFTTEPPGKPMFIHNITLFF